MSGQQCGWKFDVSSFMVLVGESEEFNYRLMQRSLAECLTAAPVAGLQSYIRCNFALLEATGPSYFSPRGCTTAPLRNMRLAYSISRHKLLRDGTCRVYQVSATKKFKNTLQSLSIVAGISWTLFFGILGFALTMRDTSWIGLSASVTLTTWSMILRTTERYCLQPTVSKAFDPDQHDAIYILGRRNSCFVLEGSRIDVANWTGQGLEQRSGDFIEILFIAMRIGSLLVLLYMLIVVPNGTTWDQVAFIMLNTMGQLNVMLGPKMNAKSCISELSLVKEEDAPTRTHVYAFLLRRFGNGDWVQRADLLPQTEVWDNWRHAITLNRSIDPKEQYSMCLKAGSLRKLIIERASEKDSEVEVKERADIMGGAQAEKPQGKEKLPVSREL